VDVATLRHFLIGLFKIDAPEADLQSSIENIQSFEDKENSLQNLFFGKKCTKIIGKHQRREIV
jgi:hypothetical protein